MEIKLIMKTKTIMTVVMSTTLITVTTPTIVIMKTTKIIIIHDLLFHLIYQNTADLF